MSPALGHGVSKIPLPDRRKSIAFARPPLASLKTRVARGFDSCLAKRLLKISRGEGRVKEKERFVSR